MRPRARTEATPIKVVHSPPPPTTTTTRMREGRRASSGVLAGRIDPGSLVTSQGGSVCTRPADLRVLLPSFISASRPLSVLFLLLLCSHSLLCLSGKSKEIPFRARPRAPARASAASPWLIALPPVLRHQQRVRRRTVDGITDGAFASGLNNITRGRVVKGERGKAVLPYSIKSSPRWQWRHEHFWTA